MQVLDKRNILQSLPKEQTVVLELGCGKNPRIKHAIKIDIENHEHIDIVADLNNGLSFIPDNSVDEIYSFHFLEHIENFPRLLMDIHRVLKPGGKIAGSVPHFSNPYYYSDPTHKTFFGLYTFSYFSNEPYFKRRVPSYSNIQGFKIKNIKIVFYSPFFVRNVFRKLCMFFFNFNKFFLERYEAGWCYLFPAHEIEFELIKN